MQELTQEISIISMILLIVSFISLGVAIIAIQSNRKLSLRLNKAVELINSLHRLNQNTQSKLTELDSHQANLSKSIKQELATELANSKTSILALQGAEFTIIKDTVDKLQAEVEDISQQDPAAKMYAKAHTLVESGASVEEIMDACDLPKAEVEVLFGFQKKAKK